MRQIIMPKLPVPRDIFTPALGYARSLIALCTGLTMLLTSPHVMLYSNTELVSRAACTDLTAATLYCLIPTAWYSMVQIMAGLMLLVIASGWRPRVTGLLHWWLTWSFHQTGTLVDGGDQVAMVLTLLLIPIASADPRTWHWQRIESAAPWTGALAAPFLSLFRLQVAVIYFHSAIAKLVVPEWLNGTAIYYWFNSVTLGMPDWLRPILNPLLTSPIPVLCMTWGAIILEIFLAMGLIADRRFRVRLMWLGIFFHTGIAIAFGITSFVLVMWGALILFLGADDIPQPKFAYPRLGRVSPVVIHRTELS
jgi:antimicrobial peptide system SdpB family protein